VLTHNEDKGKQSQYGPPQQLAHCNVGYVCNLTINPKPQHRPSQAWIDDICPIKNRMVYMGRARHVTNVTYV